MAFHPDARKFDPIVVGHRDAIKVVFDKLDKNKNGYLEKEELKDIVAKYQGEAFDADKFFGWYDTHGPGRPPHRRDRVRLVPRRLRALARRRGEG